MGSLTEKQVLNARLPAGKAELLLSDGDGLFLRLREGKAGTAKSWIHRFMLKGVVHKSTLGSYPELGLAQARQQVFESSKLIQAGQDPVAVKKAAAAQEHAAAVIQKMDAAPLTVKELGEAWLSKYAAVKHLDAGYSRAVFVNHVYPVLGKVQLDLLRVRHIVGLLDALHATGKTRTCGIVLSHLRQAVQWGMIREYIAGDVTSGLKATDWGGRGNKRKRRLSHSEIKALHYLVPLSSLAERWQHAIWLILAVGTRVEETLLAEVSQVDLVAKRWVIPAVNQKKVQSAEEQEEHIIDLHPFALKQMESLITLAGKGKYLFPSRLKERGETPANEKTLTHAVGDRQTDSPKTGRTQQSNELKLEGGPWTPHDLRRTMATQMGELRVRPDVIDRCLNHAVGGLVQQTYQHQEVRDLMSEAWAAWNDKLTSLLAEAARDEALGDSLREAAQARRTKE
jgi:integrase